MVRRVITTVVGGSVLLIGAALLVLPGPAFVVIPIGMAILASEFAWARLWLRRARKFLAPVLPRKGRAGPPKPPAITAP
ncbi:MAG: PGPGW domain-containing protein [Kiritimatiellae bacterium]|nr:PGPGW domain-containing protein [Kiritimatiellia bacterium]